MVMKPHRLRLSGNVVHTEEKTITHATFIVNSMDKSPLEGPRRRLEDNNKTDLKGLKYNGIDQMELAQ
jgi:hypothetical protein